MRYVGLLLGVIAVLAFVGCGDRDPVSSVSEDGIAPAGKLTVSASKAGGHPGRRGLLALETVSRASFNAHDVDGFLAYFTDDAVLDYVAAGTPMSGKEQIGAFLQSTFDAFPDFLDVSPHRLVFGNTVVTECRPTATHLGEWGGIPATGKETSVPHLSIYEYDGGKLKKLTFYDDTVSFLTQIGVMPAGELPSLVPSFELPDPEPTGLSPMKANAEASARYNSLDLSEWAKIFTSDAVVKYNTLGGVPMTREALVALNELYFLAFPDIHMEIVREVNMGDGWVLTEAIGTGTNTGPYFGLPATELPSEVRIAWLHRFNAEGLSTDFYVYFDSLIQLVQLGLAPAP